MSADVKKKLKIRGKKRSKNREAIKWEKKTQGQIREENKERNGKNEKNSKEEKKKNRQGKKGTRMKNSKD